MAMIKHLKPGQTVWKVWPQGLGGTRLKHDACAPVLIVEVCPRHSAVKAQWGSNPPRWYAVHTAVQWRVRQPRGVKLRIFKHCLR